MHGGELSIVRLSDVNVERLALINVGTAVSSHLQNALLRYFPHRLVQVFEILRNSLNVLKIRKKALISKYPNLELQKKYLNGSPMGNDGSLDHFIPQPQLSQISEQVMVDDLEFAREHTASVDVGCVGLDALIVSEDLSGGSSRHGSNEQRVAHAVLLDLFTQLGPIPQLGARINTPHVKLQDLDNTKEYI